MAESKAQAKEGPSKESRIVCQRTDLPLKHRKPVQEAVRKLFAACVNGKDDKKRSQTARWGDFARALKASLDKNLEPHWHVLVGNHLGFACKKRDQTMGVWRIGETSVVIWKSPGYEGPAASPGASSSGAAAAEPKESDAAEAKATDAADGEPAGDSSAPAATSSRTSAATLRVQEPTSVEAGSEVERTIALLREEIAASPSEDVQEVAQAVRRRLTNELGPIWHVVTGAEFVAEVAEDCRNHVVATAGKHRIVCFQHEQFVQSSIDVGKILSALPYLLMVVFCFGYMTLNAVCQETPPSEDKVLAWWVRKRFCRVGWEQDIYAIGGCAMVGLMVSKKWKSFFPEPKGWDANK